MRRYVETAFRHRNLVLVPVLAIPIISLLTALSAGRQYEVTAALWVSPSPFLVTVPADPRNPAGPNEAQAQALKEWTATESFRQTVMDRVGLTAAIQTQQWPVPSRLQNGLEETGLASIPGLRSILSLLGLTKPSGVDEAMGIGLDMVGSTVGVRTEGKNTLLVTYRGKEPLLGTRLVEETVALFNEKTVALRADEASAAIQFYAEQVRVQGERLTQAALAVQQFEDAHPIRRGQPRPVAEQQELDLLRRQLTLEQTAYETTLGKAEDVRLKGEAAISGEDRSFQVVDPPKAPSADGVSKKALMTAVFAGGVLGVMLAALPVLYLTWTDNRIRSRSDVERVLKPRFIAEVPFVTAPAGPPLDPTRHALSRGGEQPL